MMKNVMDMFGFGWLASCEQARQNLEPRRLGVQLLTTVPFSRVLSGRRLRLLSCLGILMGVCAFATPSGAQEPEPPAATSGTQTVAPNAEKSDTGARTITPIEAGVPKELAEGLSIEALSKKDYLDYDEQTNTAYSKNRTRVSYMVGGQKMQLEADEMRIDLAQKKVKADGNVVLTRGSDGEVHAKSLTYDFVQKTGSASGMSGRYTDFRLTPYGDESVEGPAAQQLSESEAVFQKVEFTGCEFAVPHYYIRAREIVVFKDEKLMMRGATVYLRGVPVFYLPFYSKSLREGSPWFVRAGYNSRIGAYGRLGYAFRHELRKPSLNNDKKTETVSEGRLALFVDYLSKRGPGEGFDYEYNFLNDKHRGKLNVYSLSDSNRKVEGEDDMTRDYVGFQHRSEVAEGLVWTANVDWLNDAEIFDDVLDVFNDNDRNRVMERRARTALTLTREYYVARILFEVKDRVGRDRINNYASPSDNDRDFDEQPDKKISNRHDEGIPTDRWGTASMRAPQITMATTWLKMWNLPFYYYSDLNIFNNLDKGLNAVSSDDDAMVRGVDWYQAMMGRWRISKRTTLMARVGAGVGMAAREDDEFGYNFDATPDDPLTLEDREGGLTFVGPETFLVGRERYNLKDDVSDGFAYGDTMLRLQHRFSDALTFNLTHRFRETTEDSLGEWYASMGDRFVRDDLYNFRLREHNIDAVLRYYVARPRLQLALRSYRNLISGSELYANEPVSANVVSGSWSSADQRLSFSGSTGVYETQIFDPSDPLQYTDSALGWRAYTNYRPASGLWWARFGAQYYEQLDQSSGGNDNYDRYTEEDNETTIRTVLGGRVGPKWTSEVTSDWNSRISGFRKLRFGFSRDMHDALLVFSIGFRNNIYDSSSNDSSSNQMDFRVGIQPKSPTTASSMGMGGLKVINDTARTPEVSEPVF
ncbi:MAG TPA: hypothetical protein PLA90_01295 [Candidatus Sumerlaeota bacterium]|nr:hypothetical protein [Candidatus Sumerlaeota bacterium]